MKNIIFAFLLFWSFVVSGQTYCIDSIRNDNCRLEFINSSGTIVRELITKDVTWYNNSVGSYIIRDLTTQLTIRLNCLDVPEFDLLGDSLDMWIAECQSQGSLDSFYSCNQNEWLFNGDSISCSSGISGDSLWQEYLLGLKPIGDKPIYLANLAGCNVDSANIGVAYQGAQDSFITTTLTGSYSNALTSATITGNVLDSLLYEDGRKLRVTTTVNASAFSIPVNFGSFCGLTIDSFQVVLKNVQADAINIDSTNEVPIVLADIANPYLYFLSNGNDLNIFANGTNSELVLTVVSNKLNLNTFGGISDVYNLQTNLTFIIKTAQTLSIDKVFVRAYYNGSVINSNLGINPITGEVIILELDSISSADNVLTRTEEGIITYTNPSNYIVFLESESERNNTLGLHSISDSISDVRITAKSNLNFRASVQTVAESDGHPVNEMTIRYLGEDIDFKLDEEAFWFGNSEDGLTHYTFPLTRGLPGQYLRVKKSWESGNAANCFWGGGEQFNERYYNYVVSSDTLAGIEGKEMLYLSSDSNLVLNSLNLLQIDIPSASIAGQVLTTVNTSGGAEWVTPSGGFDSIYDISEDLFLSSLDTIIGHSEYLTYSGTRINEDLVIKIGDYDKSSTGMRIEFPIEESGFYLLNGNDDYAGYGIDHILLQAPMTGDFSFIGTGNITGERVHYLPDTTGTFVLSVNDVFANDKGNINLDTTNQIQTLSISNDTLSISDGNSVVLPSSGGISDTLIDSDTITWDASLIQKATVLLGGDRVLNIINSVDGQDNLTLKVVQDGIGSRLLTYMNALFSGGTDPTLTTDINAVDIITFINMGGQLYGAFLPDFK